MSKRLIEVVDYDSSWPAKFSQERQKIVNLLGTHVIYIEHIGSTAVKGLAAKPVIDILIEINEVTLLDQFNSAFETLGYKVKGENGIKGRRYFQKGGNLRSHQIHAFKTGDEHLLRHKAFRDYLIHHPAIAYQYGEVKKSAAQQCQHNSAKYMALKNDFILYHEPLALIWYKEQNNDK